MAHEILAYHYTTPGNCKSMFTGESRGLGLQLGRRLAYDGRMKEIPDERLYSPVCHALFDPLSWADHPDFPHAWSNLMVGIGLLGHADGVLDHYALLELTLTPEDDAYVFERATLEKLLHTPREDLTDEMFAPAWIEYWQSQVPLFEYEGGFSVPSIVMWNPIPLERIEVAEYVESKYIESEEQIERVLAAIRGETERVA